MRSMDHQIIEIRTDEDELDTFWRCRCGETNTGYADVADARLAAAEHQLPPAVQREIDERDHQDVDSWCDDVAHAADDEAHTHPTRWQWYHQTAPPPDR